MLEDSFITAVIPTSILASELIFSALNTQKQTFTQPCPETL